MSLCPSCGREVGSHVTCPHCGANLKRRLTITLFGLLAIALAGGGLALLYVASVNSSVPSVRIGQIQAAMNFAYVRVEGVVDRSPNFNPESESLTFWIDDGSGRMLIAAFRSEARALIDAGRVPSIGDRASVEGALRVRDDAPSLTINSIDALTLTRAVDSAAERDLSSITAEDALTGVRVRGQARAVRQLSGGLRLITLRDLTGEIDVAIDGDIDAFGEPAPDVAVGDSVEAVGVVTLFEDTPQVTLARGDHLSLVSEPVEIAAVKSLRELGDDDIGQWARVQGTITRVEQFSAGMKFTLNDAQRQSIVLLLWQDVFDALPDAADWLIGAEVTAQGQINSFRGELEIVPEIALDVAVLTRAVVEAPPTLNLTRIGSIGQDDIGKTVFISGTVQSVEQFSAGARAQVEDDTGSIQLVLFSEVYDQVEDNDQLEAGASVSALGRVGEFNGALEVIPPNGGSVRVLSAVRVAQVTPTPAPPRATPRPTQALTTTLEATATPTASASITATVSITPTVSVTPTVSTTPTAASTGVTAIGSIDASLIGQSVTVRGQVVAVSSFSAGFRFTLNDDSGAIQLVLFDGRYREVADRAGLNLGARVSVRAIVASFNDRLELQPSSGADVIIEQPGSNAIIAARAINTLSSSDIGSLVAVVGDVLRVEGFSSGVSVFVNDGSGELRVVIFSNVLNYVPNAPNLQAGARARVVGRIDEFSGALELVPALGYDVTINP